MIVARRVMVAVPEFRPAHGTAVPITIANPVNTHRQTLVSFGHFPSHSESRI
jgi:hypothetical protein